MNAFKFKIGQIIKSKRFGEMKVLFRWHRPPGENIYDVQFLTTEKNCTYDEKELEKFNESQSNRNEVQTNREIARRQ
jgi:hypothetical protein